MNTNLAAAIKRIEYYLPAGTLATSDLSAEFPEWPVEKIEQKTGISVRHIAAPGECASDLAVAAAQKLFESGACAPAEIDFVLFCTQSPDYYLPTTACLIQKRLGIPTSAGALDFNLGCSGFVYGLALAQGLIERGNARNALLLTAETYSKHMHPGDRSVRTLFGDAGAATLVTGIEAEPGSRIGPFVFGTDGRGAENLIVPAGGMRTARTAESGVAQRDAGGNIRSQDNLFMNGGEIFTFTLSAVPKAVNQLLAKAEKTKDDVGLFVFHQANQYMLEALRKNLKLPPERFFMHLKDCGNTVSATIPIALKAAQAEGKLQDGDLVMVVGFGVGYSWAAALIRWTHK